MTVIGAYLLILDFLVKILVITRCDFRLSLARDRDVWFEKNLRHIIAKLASKRKRQSFKLFIYLTEQI